MIVRGTESAVPQVMHIPYSAAYSHHLQFTHLPGQILLALITDRGIRNFNQTPFSPLTAFVGSPPGAVIA